jgi:hypothetical protein
MYCLKCCTSLDDTLLRALKAICFIDVTVVTAIICIFKYCLFRKFLAVVRVLSHCVFEAGNVQSENRVSRCCKPKCTVFHTHRAGAAVSIVHTSVSLQHNIYSFVVTNISSYSRNKRVNCSVMYTVSTNITNIRLTRSLIWRIQLLTETGMKMTCLLKCCAVCPDKSLPTFQRHLLLPSGRRIFP